MKYRAHALGARAGEDTLRIQDIRADQRQEWNIGLASVGADWQVVTRRRIVLTARGLAAYCTLLMTSGYVRSITRGFCAVPSGKTRGPRAGEIRTGTLCPEKGATICDTDPPVPGGRARSHW